MQPGSMEEETLCLPQAHSAVTLRRNTQRQSSMPIWQQQRKPRRKQISPESGGRREHGNSHSASQKERICSQVAEKVNTTPWAPSRGDEHRAPDLDAQQRLREGQLVQVVQLQGPMHWLNGSIGELVSYDFNLVRWKVKFPNAILEVPAPCLSQERSKGGWNLEAQLAEQRHRAPWPPYQVASSSFGPGEAHRVGAQPGGEAASPTMVASSDDSLENRRSWWKGPTQNMKQHTI